MAEYKIDIEKSAQNILDRVQQKLGISAEQLMDLVQAYQDGRCVVLPCKDWLDIVFGEQEIFYAIDDDYVEEKVREITVRNEERFTWYDGWQTVMFKGADENGLDYEFSPEEIGKNVFLTERAAQAALKGGTNHDRH